MHAGARDPATAGGGEATRARAMDHLTAARLHLPASARLHLPVAARLHHPSAAAPRPPRPPRASIPDCWHASTSYRSPWTSITGGGRPTSTTRWPPRPHCATAPSVSTGCTASPPPPPHRAAPSVTPSTQLQAQLAADHAVFLKELVSNETSTPPHSPTASAISVRPLLPLQPVSRAVQHRPYTRFKDIVERRKADVKVGIFLVFIPVVALLRRAFHCFPSLD